MITKRKKQRRKVKTLFILKRLSFVLIILTCIWFVGYLLLALSVNTVTQSQFLALDEPVSILVIGTDTGGDNRSAADDGARADAIMLVTINPTNARGNVDISITSVPRDTRAYIPCADTYDKINSSLSYGYTAAIDSGATDSEAMNAGSLCTEQAVEQGFGINIDYYMTADFNGLIDVIDAIGGITIDVPYAFTEQDANGTADAISIEAGKQELDGEAALAYSRQRHAINPETGMSGDDWERNIRQQEVLAATVKKILSDPTTNIPKVSAVLFSGESVWTDMTAETFANLGNYAVTFYNQQMMTLSNHQNITVLFKESTFQHSVGINPYQDLSGLDFSNVIPNTGSDFVTPTTEAGKYFADNTIVYPATIDYRATTAPTAYNTDIPNPPQKIEFTMSTLSTQTAQDGSNDEIVTGPVQYYFASQIAQSSGQTTTLTIDEYGNVSGTNYTAT